MQLTSFISKSLILGITLLPTLSMSQNVSESIPDTLSNISAEKVFLHIDRNIYSPGDDIWYKAYLLDDLTFLPAESSSNLHVELISSNGKIVDSNTNYLEGGIGQGNFHLKDSIPDGTYQIRAYTNYMRNFDDLLFFRQFITINEPESNKKFELPEVHSNGIGLTVNYIRSKNIEISISVPQESFHTDTCKLIVQSRAIVSVEKSIILKNPNTKILISKDELPSGISTITLMDFKGIPIAERLIYIPVKNNLNVEVKQKKQLFGLREKVKLIIETKDNNGNPCQANLSLAVTDTIGWSCNVSNIPELSSYSLLTSNFHGSIEDPSYYFENQNINKIIQLDLVLLTHGWRRYIWKEISELKSVKNIFKYENGFSITGNVQHLLWNKPLNNCKVTLFSPSDEFVFLEEKTDSNGFFRFDNLLVSDTAKLIVQAYNNKDRQESRIKFDINTYNPHPVSLFEQPLFQNEISGNYLKNLEEQKFLAEMSLLKDNIMMDEIKIIGNKKKVEDGHVRLYSHASTVIDLNKLPNTPITLASTLRGRVVGLVVVGQCPNINFILRGIRSPLIVLDGMPIDTSYFCDLDPVNIDKIEILNVSQAAIFGSRGGRGVIAVYTKQGKEFSPTFRSVEYGIEHIKPRAFQRVREFYSPNYSLENDLFKYKDLRTTILWSPAIITDKQGRAEVSFYTADKNARYNVVVQGVSEQGAMGFQKTSFDVKANE